MAYNFKNLADVELLEAMPEEANVVVEVNGTTKRAPNIDVEAKIVSSETLEEVPEGATVLAEVSGQIKRVPSAGLGGSSGYEFIVGYNGHSEYSWVKGNGLDFINRLIDGPAPLVCVHATNKDHEYPSVEMHVPYNIAIASGSGKWCAIFPEPGASGIYIDMETGEIQND